MVVDVRLPNTDAAALASMGGAGANGGVEAGDDECGGYGTTAAGKLDIIATMVHEGEVNR